MTLGDPNPGLLTSRISQKRCNTFKFYNIEHTIIDHQGLYRKRAKTGVVVENFAQEGQKFSCLRTIGLYGEGSFGGGGVDDTLARGH